jgi:hypothetical protein
MPMWGWIAIGVGSFVGLSVLVGLALARILGTIGRQVADMYETEDWAMVPPNRAAQAAEEREPQQDAAKQRRVGGRG